MKVCVTKTSESRPLQLVFYRLYKKVPGSKAQWQLLLRESVHPVHHCLLYNLIPKLIKKIISCFIQF